MMNTKRRQILKSFCLYGGLAGVTACAQSSDQPQSLMNSEADQARANRFHGVSGAEWVLSSVDELRWIEILNQDGRYVDAAAAAYPRSRSRFSINRIPVRLKITWREQDPNNPVYSGNRNESWSGGKITGSFEIPVADRIPDELLDDLRRDPKGSLRIKVRLHRDGVLLGWDIERMPGYDRKNRDPWGKPMVFSSVYSFVGGDFREAEIINGKPVRMGWYIHPKTGQRIETPY